MNERSFVHAARTVTPVDMAAAKVLGEMATFDSAGVADKRPPA
jgi:hypothetical protein